VNPETPLNTIHGSVWDLATRFPYTIHKPSRGLYLPAHLGDGTIVVTQPPTLIEQHFKEEDYYEAFADWLKNELDEATVAVPLGGAGFQKK
jgi:hypothetical protein